MNKRKSRVKQHTVGEVRYFTYYLYFPGENDYWVDQQPFVGNLADIMHTTKFFKMPDVAQKLMKDGEAHWKDHNGVTHRVIIEDVQRPRKWGVKHTH